MSKLPNYWIYGPAGSGKSTLADQLAAINKNFSIFPSVEDALKNPISFFGFPSEPGAIVFKDVSDSFRVKLLKEKFIEYFQKKEWGTPQFIIISQHPPQDNREKWHVIKALGNSRKNNIAELVKNIENSNLTDANKKFIKELSFELIAGLGLENILISKEPLPDPGRIILGTKQKEETEDEKGKKVIMIDPNMPIISSSIVELFNCLSGYNATMHGSKPEITVYDHLNNSDFTVSSFACIVEIIEAVRIQSEKYGRKSQMELVTKAMKQFWKDPQRWEHKELYKFTHK